MSTHASRPWTVYSPSAELLKPLPQCPSRRPCPLCCSMDLRLSDRPPSIPNHQLCSPCPRRWTRQHTNPLLPHNLIPHPTLPTPTSCAPTHCAAMRKCHGLASAPVPSPSAQPPASVPAPAAPALPPPPAAWPALPPRAQSLQEHAQQRDAHKQMYGGNKGMCISRRLVGTGRSA